MIDAARADELARLAHGEDRTKAGTRFIDHVRSVAARMGDDPDPYAIVAALLHDSVEKGSFGWRDLWAAGADSRLLEIVDALTERDGEPEMVYLGRCAADPLALRIKRADITDKLDGVPGSNIAGDDLSELRQRAQRRLDMLEQVAARRWPSSVRPSPVHV